MLTRAMNLPVRHGITATRGADMKTTTVTVTVNECHVQDQSITITLGA